MLKSFLNYLINEDIMQPSTPGLTKFPNQQINITVLDSSIEPNFFEKVWKTICKIASAIFSCFSCLFSKNYFFSEREITLLDRHARAPIPQQPLPLTPLQRKITVPISEDSLPLDEPKNPEPIYNEFDDSLEDLRECAREFAKLGIKFVYDNRIAAH